MPEHERVVALVGCTDLLGSEVKDRLSDGPLSASRVNLLEAKGDSGVMTAFGDEPSVASALEKDSFKDADLVILACAPADAAGALALRRKKGAVVVTLVAGSGGPAAPAVNLAVNPGALDDHQGVVEAAAPLPLLLSSLLSRVDRAAGVLRVEAVAFEPASGLGRSAMDELHKQTLDLLSFTDGPRETYGRQIAFNLLPLSLTPPAGGSAREQELARQTGRILGWKSTRLALKVILAPVFHGHAAAIHIETDRGTDVEGLRAAFDDAAFDAEEIGDSEDGPSTPAEWAGEERLRVAEISDDGRGAFWIWAFRDDLKSGAAANAVKIAETLSGL